MMRHTWFERLSHGWSPIHGRLTSAARWRSVRASGRRQSAVKPRDRAISVLESRLLLAAKVIVAPASYESPCHHLKFLDYRLMID